MKDSKMAKQNLEQRTAKLTSFSIQNFKGIGQKIKIDLKPITLIYGKNSAGKSSILHALHCAHTILATNNPNVKDTIYGGKLDLGGFQNYVHQKKLENAVVFSFELIPSIDDIDEIIGNSSKNTKGNEILNSSKKIENIGISMRIGWSEFRTQPIVSKFCVSVNEEKIVEIVSDTEGYNNWISNTNISHPILNTKINKTHSDKISEMSLPVALPTGMALPRLDVNIPSTVFLLDDIINLDSDESITKVNYSKKYDPSIKDNLKYIQKNRNELFDIFNEIGNLINVTQNCLVKTLERMLYVGPFRIVPNRGYTPPEVIDKKRWASGQGAWDEMATNENLLSQVNFRLNGSGGLNTGYKIDWENRKEVDNDELDRLLSENSTENTSVLITNFIESSPTKRKLLISDEETGLNLDIDDLGEGIAQIIPVIASAYYGSNLTSTKHNKIIQTVVIENPELHTHPRMQLVLGDIFLSRILDSQFLVETQSEHIVLRMLRRVRESNNQSNGNKQLDADDISVLYVRKLSGKLKIQPIRLDNDGEFIDQWPEGFFDERLEELL